MDKKKLDLSYMIQLVKKSAQFDMIRDYVANSEYVSGNDIRAMLGIEEEDNGEK